MRRQNNGYLELFAKNYFLMLLEIEIIFRSLFSHLHFEMIFCHKSYYDVINSFLFVPTEWFRTVIS